ncbi:uncharacterized protein LOC120342802 [Styela clava]
MTKEKKMTNKTRIELSHGEQDWTEVRESFVRAFHHYSLYKYLIPNEQTRPKFLRKYLEAIYDVTIRNGNSILLVGRTAEDNTIIGGAMVVPPAKDYGGWECEKADNFYEAYEKYKLREIDHEAFERMEKYEEWEYENISKHVCSTKVPLWNGIFCAVDPKYAGKGRGSLSYSECLNIINNIRKNKSCKEKEFRKSRVKSEEHLHGIVQKLRKFYENLTDSEKLINPVEYLTTSRSSTTRNLPVHIGTNRDKNGPIHGDEKFKKTSKKSMRSMIFMISHSRQAVHFHQKNGFQSIVDIPYYEEPVLGIGDSPFNVNVLLMDPLETGGIAKISHALSHCGRISTNHGSEQSYLKRIRGFYNLAEKCTL